MFGLHHSLHRPPSEAKFFYGAFAAIIAAAAGIVLIPGAPLGVITTAVQALAGVLLPSASVFLLLLCNDRAVLGPWVNRGWLNVLATFIVGVLFMLSAVLVVTTVFPHVNIGELVVALAVVFALAGGALAIGALRSQRTREPAEPSAARRQTWQMPPLALLDRPTWSRSRVVVMAFMWGYLALAVVLLVVKAAQLAGH